MDEKGYKKRRDMAIYIIKELAIDKIFYNDFMDVLRDEFLKQNLQIIAVDNNKSNSDV